MNLGGALLCFPLSRIVKRRGESYSVLIILLTCAKIVQVQQVTGKLKNRINKPFAKDIFVLGKLPAN